MRIRDWSSDVCSSDLTRLRRYSRIPALSTATTRAVTDAVPAAEGVIDLATASGATTGATAGRRGAGTIADAGTATRQLVEGADAAGSGRAGRVVAIRRATARATRPTEIGRAHV